MGRYRQALEQLQAAESALEHARSEVADAGGVVASLEQSLLPFATDAGMTVQELLRAWEAVQEK